MPTPAYVLLGASASALKRYELSPNTALQYSTTPLTEFAAPIRLGLPDFDARLVASTISFPDFSGGAGKYVPDSRTEAARFWRSTCDTRNQGVIALLPKWTAAAAVTTQPGNDNGAASFAFSDVFATNRLYMANGNRIYSTTGTAWADVMVTTGAGWTGGAATDYTYRLRNIVHVTTAGVMTEYLFWMTSSGMMYCSGDPTLDASWLSTGTGAAGRLDVAETRVDVAIDPITSTRLVMMTDTGLILTKTAAPWDAATASTVGAIGRGGHFLGALQGILYLVDGKGNLWNYDPAEATNEQVRIQATGLPRVRGGIPWKNAEMVLHDGRRIIRWHPSRPSLEITPGSPDGFPTDLALTVDGVFTLGERLLAYVSYASTVGIIEFKGGGWHLISPQITGTWQFNIPSGTLANDDAVVLGDSGFGFDHVNNRHWIAFQDANDLKTRYNTMPPNDGVPYVQEILAAGDGFESTGEVETGWHYMGLRSLSGPALQVRLLGEMPDTNASIVVSYKTNFDETAWTVLGTLTSAVRSLSFASGAGLEFRVIRFKLALAQTGGGGGGTSAKSPNAAFSVDFLKVPDHLHRHVIPIDAALTSITQGVDAATIHEDLHTLAEQKTLCVLQVEDRGRVFVKLETPRESGFMVGDKLYSTFTVTANEVL
jgi:hypothetical protein